MVVSRGERETFQRPRDQGTEEGRVFWCARVGTSDDGDIFNNHVVRRGDEEHEEGQEIQLSLS
jgi:hypothetical protein